MHFYPLFMNLAGAKALVVGAGAVGLRKTEGLAACAPAQILLLDPNRGAESFTPDERALLADPSVVYEQRPVRPDDLTGCALVFACTSERAVNRELADWCRKRGILCNVVDDPAACDFIVPAHFRQDEALVAISTGGGSPALARRMRRELQDWFSGRYGPLLLLLKRLRPQVLALGGGSRENAALFSALTESALAELLTAGRMAEARELLASLLPEALHPRMGELLDDLV